MGMLDQGVFVDSEGYIAEGPVMNIGIITHEGEMAVPPFTQTLDGITLQRLLQLMREARTLAAPVAVANTHRLLRWPVSLMWLLLVAVQAGQAAGRAPVH